MMTFTAAPAALGLAPLIARPVIGGHDVRQFMQARLFTSTDVTPAVRADLDPALSSVSVTSSLSTHHGYRDGVCREHNLEPVHLLDSMNVSGTMLIGYYAVILNQHRAGHLADRQPGCQLRVIRCFLKPGRPNPSLPCMRAP
jgi:hypothetical protein